MNYLKQVVGRLQQTASLLPSRPVASARLLVSPGAGAAATASSPGALPWTRAAPWKRAASCASPSNGAFQSPSGGGILASWGAALRAVAGRGTGGGSSTGVLAGQQLAGRGAAFSAAAVLPRAVWPSAPGIAASTGMTPVPLAGGIRSLAGRSRVRSGISSSSGFSNRCSSRCDACDGQDVACALLLDRTVALELFLRGCLGALGEMRQARFLTEPDTVLGVPACMLPVPIMHLPRTQACTPP